MARGREINDTRMRVSGSQIAAFLGKSLVGKDFEVTGAAPLSKPEPNGLVFAAKYDPAAVEMLNATRDVLVLAAPEYEGRLTTPHIITARARLDFAKVLQEFFAPRRASGIARTAVVAPSAVLGGDISIGHFSIIGEKVQIGDNTEIRHHVILGDNCIIGKNCLIKSHTVIGEEGFGFAFEDDGTPVRIPHLGHVVIGDEVEIGALNVVARATLAETAIGDHVKTDDHVFIGHNAVVGENTIITAAVEVGGSVIGRNVWIGPQACIIEKIEIGDEALIGLGAVVTKSVEPNVVVVGNPARVLRKRFSR